MSHQEVNLLSTRYFDRDRREFKMATKVNCTTLCMPSTDKTSVEKTRRSSVMTILYSHEERCLRLDAVRRV